MGPRDHLGCAIQSDHTAQGRPQDLVPRRREEFGGPVTDTCRKRTQWVSRALVAWLPLAAGGLWARRKHVLLGGHTTSAHESHGGQDPAPG